MGRVALNDNYRCSLDGNVHTFRAVSDRQAFYMAYDLLDGELADSLVEIDDYGMVVRELIEEV